MGELMKFCSILALVATVGCGSTATPLPTRDDECYYMTDLDYDATVAVFHEMNLAGLSREFVFIELGGDLPEGGDNRGLICLGAMLEDEWD